MVPNHSEDALGSILGPMGPHWVQKMCQNRKKLPCPKIRIFYYLAVIEFLQKVEVTVMAPNHGGDTIESILGPIGSHSVKKMGQNSQKLPCPKIRNFDYPAVIDFSHKMEVTVMAPNQGGDPLGSILGPVGSHWVQKMGQTVKNYHAPKFEFSVIGFSQKMELKAMAPNHGGDPLGSILGPKWPHWVQKMCQNRKQLTCPKIRIFDYPQSSIFPIKWKLRLWRQITVGTP